MTADFPVRQLWPAPTGAGGPLDDEALTALYRRAAAPWLRVNFVTSIDGAAELDGRSAGLSGGPDKRVFGILRMVCDALLVGAGTLRQERYRALRPTAARVQWRRRHGLAEFPTLVVVSAALDLDPAQPAFAEAPVRPVVLTHAAAEPPPGLAEVAELVRCGDDRIDLAAGLDRLRRRGLDQVLCEGGPRLFGALTAADLVDEVCLTVAPLLAGPGPGRISTGPTGPDPTGPDPAGPDPAGARRLPLRHVLGADDGTLLLRHARD
jgi:riboflavin biosynthesis pyrimidine reductase